MNPIDRKRVIKEIDLLTNKFNAINSEIRLSLMSLLYVEDQMTFSDLASETKLDSNKLAYHLNILTKAKFIKKINSHYILTNAGERILDDIGLKKEIEDFRVKAIGKREREITTKPRYRLGEIFIFEELQNKPHLLNTHKFIECYKKIRPFLNENVPSIVHSPSLEKEKTLFKLLEDRSPFWSTFKTHIGDEYKDYCNIRPFQNANLFLLHSLKLQKGKLQARQLKKIERDEEILNKIEYW